MLLTATAFVENHVIGSTVCAFSDKCRYYGPIGFHHTATPRYPHVHHIDSKMKLVVLYSRTVAKEQQNDADFRSLEIETRNFCFRALDPQIAE